MGNELFELEALDNATLVARVQQLIKGETAAAAEVIAHIGEIDARELYLGIGFASMYGYCVGQLNMAEGAVYKRLRVARASRKFPVLLELIADGRLHVTGAALLIPHLNENNIDDVLARAIRRSKRDIEKLIAELAPKPDVPSGMRALPTRRSRPDPPLASAHSSPESSPGARPASGGLSPGTVMRDAKPVPVMTPLAPARFKVQFTASQQLRDKLARLRALTRHQVPDGDLAAVVELAVDAYLGKIEARRFGKTAKPRTKVSDVDTTPRTRHIPAAVRREVVERDGNRCTFVGQDGRRCDEIDDLQFDHIRAYSRRGPHTVENLTLRCGAHNRYRAKLEFGPRRAAPARDVAVAYRATGPPS